MALMKFDDLPESGFYWIRAAGESAWVIGYVNRGWSIFNWPNADFYGPIKPPSDGDLFQDVPVYSGTYHGKDGALYSVQIRGDLAEVAAHADRLGIGDLGLLVGELEASPDEVDRISKALYKDRQRQ